MIARYRLDSEVSVFFTAITMRVNYATSLGTRTDTCLLTGKCGQTRMDSNSGLT